MFQSFQCDRSPLRCPVSSNHVLELFRFFLRLLGSLARGRNFVGLELDVMDGRSMRCVVRVVRVLCDQICKITETGRCVKSQKQSKFLPQVTRVIDSAAGRDFPHPALGY